MLQLHLALTREKSALDSVLRQMHELYGLRNTERQDK